MAFIYVTETTPQPIVVKNGDKVVIDIEGGGEVRIVSSPGANIKNIEIQFTGDDVADTVIIDLSTFSSYGLKIN
ncbi:MAG: hypothetical protein KJN93_05160, partial [Alphaproteobacteria bacterium]|nr:hypothetical protein [Alphaproteobacteria bacterium]